MHQFIPTKPVIFLLACTCLFLFITNTIVVRNSDSPPMNGVLSIFPIFQTKEAEDRKELLLDYCHLPNLDPWDPELKEYLDPEFNPLKSCKVKFTSLTSVVNNSIIFHPDLEEHNCTYRCLLRKNDDENAYGNWKPLFNGSKPQCDVVHIDCRDADNNVTYEYLHALIYRNEKVLPPLDSPDMPSVHVIILDAVSSSQFERSMPKTASYLRNRLKSQQMKYLNKVGLDSRLNAYGILLGKSGELIPSSPISVGYPTDWTEEPCDKYMDDEQYIGFRYRDAGYVTMIAEDYGTGIFNYPNCVGFNNTFVNHYMRPYQNFWKKTKFDDILHKYQCIEHAHRTVKYIENFLDTYSDRPSFTVSWFSDMAHDDFNGLYHYDEYFYRFFQRNEKHWNNSYVIIMGDHGFRMSSVTDTTIGDFENNNPMFWISVPQNRRIRDVLNQLSDNSNKLITHFDIYATLVNLVHPKNPTHPNLAIYGEDLFGPLREPRTCDRLRVPMQYCLCNFSKTELPENDPTAVRIAKQCVQKINQELENNAEANSRCARLSLDTNEIVTAQSFTDKENGIVLRVFWSTTPGTGQFSAVAVMEKNGTMNIISTKFPRSSLYGKEAKCIEHSLVRSYCYCK